MTQQERHNQHMRNISRHLAWARKRKDKEAIRKLEQAQMEALRTGPQGRR